MMKQSILALALGLASAAAAQDDLAARVRAELASGHLVPRITDVAEFKSLFGAPTAERTQPDGDGTFTELDYPGKLHAAFKQVQPDGPSTLVRVFIAGRPVDLGRPMLRTAADLSRVDSFFGLAGFSLARLDLRDQAERLAALPFDSETEWPAKDKLPGGFDPARILEDGKNPGLGVRALHAQGIDGRGVGIAIIDQPLLLGHEQYASRLIHYEAPGLIGTPPQMHAPAVASFAVGKDIGTAPAAALYFFATPSWIPDNAHYARALEEIVRLSETAPKGEQIKIVSLSSGMMKTQKNLDRWQAALRKAEAAGILVITCDPESIDFGNLTRALDKDPDSPASYAPEAWDKRPHDLWVPGGRRTRASPAGDSAYAFDVVGGRSWSTPYLAGVAALGYQLNPRLKPSETKKLLIESAQKTAAGPMIDPAAFVALVKKTLR